MLVAGMLVCWYMVIWCDTVTPVTKWLGQKRTANNESAIFGDRYNYIVSGKFTIGSTSSDYITNTHTVYYPHPQDKLVSMNLIIDDSINC